MTTLYKHRIFCLHGTTGQITADVGAADTTFAVQQAVIDDVTIAVGSIIELNDGTNTSIEMAITAIDDGADTITVDTAPGQAFLAATPTNVNRAPHWVDLWTETATELTTCPENAAHAVQAASAYTADIRTSDSVSIRQTGGSTLFPSLRTTSVDAGAGADVTVNYSCSFPVNLLHISIYSETINSGDTIDIFLAPDTNAGTVSGAVGAAASVIGVTQTVIDAVHVGMKVSINEGATTDDLGNITAVDDEANTITVSVATTNTFTIAAVILTTIPLAEGAIVPAFQTKIDTTDLFTGLNITAETVLRFIYHNQGVAAARIVACMKCLV